MFTRVHPIIPILYWPPIVAYLIYRSFAIYELSPITVGLLGAAGAFFWTFTEYVMHRFLFHFESDHPVAKRLVFMFHGVHHDAPNDAGRLVMPPLVGTVLAAGFFGIFQLVLGLAWATPFMAFFIVGYLCYDYIHFATHHFKPRTAFGRYLKHTHMVHHYSSPNSRWGVSTPFWDIVFGTFYEKDAAGGKYGSKFSEDQSSNPKFGQEATQ